MGDYCIQEHKLVVERERYDVRRKHMTHRYMSDRSNYSRAKEIRTGRGKKAQKFIDRDTKVLEWNNDDNNYDGFGKEAAALAISSGDDDYEV